MAILIPIITVLPMSVAFALTGSFFIEQIYSIPGFGRYFIESIQAQDLSIVLGQTVLMAILYVVVVFLVDILYTVARGLSSRVARTVTKRPSFALPSPTPRTPGGACGRTPSP